MPAGFYRVTGPHGQKTVWMRPDRIVKIDNQIRRHLLCRRCEKLFNDGGENWTLANAWRSDDEFKLLTALNASVPDFEGPGFKGYAGGGVPGVDVARLVYFAASVYWRAAVHNWGISSGRPTLIDIGEHEPALRMFLLGKAPFPEFMTMLVAVNPGTTASQMFKPPELAKSTPGRNSYSLWITGINFNLSVGPDIPEPDRRQCAARTGIIAVTAKVENWRLRAAMELCRSSNVAGKLKTGRPPERL